MRFWKKKENCLSVRSAETVSVELQFINALPYMRDRVDMLKQKRQPPLLVDLCVDVAIQNVKYLGDVGETDSFLLDRILPHCTSDQLMHIENSTTGRDLSPITDKVWKAFFRRQFGEGTMNTIIGRMRERKVTFGWRRIYEAQLEYVAEKQDKSIARFTEKCKEAAAKKQSRQIRLCNKVPPGGKRNFFGGNGPGYSLSNVKSNILKKAKVDFLKSQEVKNIAAMKKNAVQRNNSSTTKLKSSSFSGTSSASSSKSMKSSVRRF